MANFDSAFDMMIRNEGGFKLTNIEGDRMQSKFLIGWINRTLKELT